MRSVILDTNVLLLLVVGECDPSKIGRQRRLKGFDLADLDNLRQVLSEFSTHISVPNVLTEASNLIGSGEQEIARGANAALRSYVLRVDEIYRPSGQVVAGSLCDKFGLADAALCEAAIQ